MKNNCSALHSVIHECTLHFISPPQKSNLTACCCAFSVCLLLHPPWHRANANPNPPICIYFAQQQKNDLCSPSCTIGFEPNSSTLSSQDITKSQTLKGNQFDHGKQCGGQLDSHWLSPLGGEDPYQWQATTG